MWWPIAKISGATLLVALVLYLCFSLGQYVYALREEKKKNVKANKTNKIRARPNRSKLDLIKRMFDGKL